MQICREALCVNQLLVLGFQVIFDALDRAMVALCASLGLHQSSWSQCPRTHSGLPLNCTRFSAILTVTSA